MGSVPSSRQSQVEETQHKHEEEKNFISSRILDPNAEENGDMLWLMKFSQFSLYGKFPPPKPRHNNLNVRMSAQFVNLSNYKLLFFHFQEAVRIDWIPLHLIPREASFIVYISHSWWSVDTEGLYPTSS